MPTPHKYAILIVNYNSWELLQSCLQALATQSCQDFDIFLIDNASNTPAPDNLLAQFPDMTFTRNAENVGFARANNQLIEQAAAAEWVILLNPDTIPAPDWLENMVLATMNHPQVDAFASRLVKAEQPDLLDGDGDCYHFSGLVWREGHNQAIASSTEVTEIFSPCAAAAMYRRQTLTAIGCFDEDFFCYVEDVDLGFRLRLIGGTSLLVPEAIVAHVGSATSGGQHSDFAIYHGHRNLVWCYIKNMPGLLFWLFLPVHLMLNLVTLIWFSLRGQSSVIFRAKWDALKGIPAMWQKRLLIQKNRKAKAADLLKMIDKRLL